MVPHDARRLSEDDDILDFMEYDDPLISKSDRFKQNTTATSSSESSSGLFGDDLDIKPE
ncbi:hypothetical protein ABG067_009208, partial [Albugo candida]